MTIFEWTSLLSVILSYFKILNTYVCIISYLFICYSKKCVSRAYCMKTIDLRVKIVFSLNDLKF